MKVHQLLRVVAILVAALPAARLMALMPRAAEQPACRLPDYADSRPIVLFFLPFGAEPHAVPTSRYTA